MKMITVNVAGLPSPVSLQIGYRDDETEQENIIRALSSAAITVMRDTEFKNKNVVNVNSVNICQPKSDAIEKEKQLYEVVFELNNGKRFFGYSAKDEPAVNGKFYHCSATKELKGRIVVTAENVSHMFFAPV